MIWSETSNIIKNNIACKKQIRERINAKMYNSLRLEHVISSFFHIFSFVKMQLLELHILFFLFEI